MKKSYKTNLILIFLITILTLYLLNSKLIVSSVLEYTELFITKLFPTSFLIYTITSLLLNYQIIETLSHITKQPSITYVIIMSLISGFPSGPKYISDLYKKDYLSQTTSNYLLKFTHFPNPLFVLGPISILLKSSSLALKILLSLLFSNLLTAVLSKTKNSSKKLDPQQQFPFPSALNKAIVSSFKLQLLIYGTNLFFYLISVVITNHIQTTPLFFVIINGAFDLIKGIFSTSLITSTYLQSLLILCFISLGSLSIHIQIKSILTDASLSYKSFLQGRLLSTIIAILCFSFLYLL